MKMQKLNGGHVPKKDKKGEHLLSFCLGRVGRLRFFAGDRSVSDIGAEVDVFPAYLL